MYLGHNSYRLFEQKLGGERSWLLNDLPRYKQQFNTHRVALTIDSCPKQPYPCSPVFVLTDCDALRSLLSWIWSEGSKLLVDSSNDIEGISVPNGGTSKHLQPTII